MPRWLSTLLLALVITTSSGIPSVVVAASAAAHDDTCGGDCTECPGGGDQGDCPPVCVFCPCGSHVLVTLAPQVPHAPDSPPIVVTFVPEIRLPASPSLDGVFHPPRFVA